MAMSSAVRTEVRYSDPAPIDLVSLATNTLGNRDLELEVLRMFKVQTASIQARVDTENLPEIQKELIHTLKGSARAIGAKKVAQVCEELEHTLEQSQTPDFSDLTCAIEEVGAYIDDLLAS